MHKPPVPVVIPVKGSTTSYPVNRIFCVGRNYADHIAEMGHDPQREPPMFFTKWAQNYVPSGSSIPYPPRTGNYHFEIELVVAIKTAGSNITATKASSHIFGYAVGLDMTRRDLQLAARDAGRPWDVGKNFEHSAPMGAICPTEICPDILNSEIRLDVNGAPKQQSTLSQMIWSVDEIICELSTLYFLQPGDLIMTGTPAGVGPVMSGDILKGRIDGLEPLDISIS
jgi:fumarylpyruvate hydrolase